MVERECGKAGSWYPLNGDDLGRMIDAWFARTSDDDCNISTLKAVIVPHAGYKFSGQTASYSFALLKRLAPKHVVVLHPSHYAYISDLQQCSFDQIKTPLGNIDVQTVNGIALSDPLVDQQEHSAEMQYPFLKHIGVAKVTPVMVGGKWSNSKVELLRQFITDHRAMVVISSDFCHFGPNFNYYLPYELQSQPCQLFTSIKQLDMAGFECIKSKDETKFRDYLKNTGNTICGQSSILLAMQLFKSDCTSKWQLLDYSQSSTATSKRDNSVSYLSAALL